MEGYSTLITVLAEWREELLTGQNARPRKIFLRTFTTGVGPRPDNVYDRRRES
jgi:hypothetical protein